MLVTDRREVFCDNAKSRQRADKPGPLFVVLDRCQCLYGAPAGQQRFKKTFEAAFVG